MKVNIGTYPKGNGKRKISVRIDKWDTWALDHSLALIIVPCLKQLKKQYQGLPGDFLGKEYNDLVSSTAYWEEKTKKGPLSTRAMSETIEETISRSSRGFSWQG